jgi:hypothetical protein
MLGTGLFIIALINAFWFTLSFVGFAYLILIFFSFRSYHRLEASQSKEDVDPS